MDKRRLFGNRCEIKAARFLEGKGYRILAHQFKTKHGEIDLVAEKDNELIFIEVKARKNTRFGYPEEAVRYNKLQKMAAAASVYLEQRELFVQPFRFDVIAMLLKENNEFEIEHLEGIDISEREC